MTDLPMTSTIYLLLPIVLTLFFVIRLFPIWKMRNQGCDAYYFLLCAEQFKKNRKLPVVIPHYFLLEGPEQWYPPLFTVLLGILPENFIKKYHWLINQIIEAITATFAYSVAAILYNPLIAAGLILIYALQTPLIMEFRGLSSRPLGLLLVVVFLFANYYFSANSDILSFAITVIVGVLIFYTHKLSMQLLWFLIPFLSLTETNFLWLLPLITSYCCAFLIYPSFFIKILRAHYDILIFWAKNWPLLGGHPVKQSPIYGDTSTKIQYFRDQGFLAILNIFRTMFHLNYWALFLPFAFFEYDRLSNFEQFLFFTILGIYVWATLTWVVPRLRFLGLGQQYVKYAYIPSFLLFTGMILTLNNPFYIALAIFCTVLTIRQYILVTRDLRKGSVTQIGFLSKDFSSMINFIKTLDNPRLMCLPFHYADLLAYVARKPVLWGGHGYGFKNLQSLFPVIEKPIHEVSKQYSITHFLVKKGYCALEKLGFTNDNLVHETDDFMLFRF